MTLTLAKGIAVVKAHPRHHGISWHNQCAAFADSMVSGIDSGDSAIGPSANTAREALAASGPLLSTDPARAVPGVFGWYSNGSSGDGHVAVYLGHGQWAMGSNAVAAAGHLWGGAGSDEGIITFSAYAQAKPAMKWVGITADYCGQIFADKHVLLKADGHPEIYQVVGAGQLHHLTPAEYAQLRRAGAAYVRTSLAVIGKFHQV